jgi:hypothetical protein
MTEDELDFSAAEIEHFRAILASEKRIDADELGYMEELLNEILECQPFMASMMLGFHHDLKPAESDAVIRIFLIIWSFYRKYPAVRINPLTEARYEEVLLRNLKRVEYAGGEEDQEQFRQVIRLDVNGMKSKSLYTIIVHRFDTLQILKEIEIMEKGQLWMGTKALIDCLDDKVE